MDSMTIIPQDSSSEIITINDSILSLKQLGIDESLVLQSHCEHMDNYGIIKGPSFGEIDDILRTSYLYENTHRNYSSSSDSSISADIDQLPISPSLINPLVDKELQLNIKAS
jgi:hypothetical protein